MRKSQRKILQVHYNYRETKVECPKCQATAIVKVADLRSNKLLRCPACRTTYSGPKGRWFVAEVLRKAG